MVKSFGYFHEKDSSQMFYGALNTPPQESNWSFVLIQEMHPIFQGSL